MTGSGLGKDKSPGRELDTRRSGLRQSPET